jgi:aspartate/methionine/tyrosine aminotransferase
VTSSTRAIIVNSPNNPSGAVYAPELIGKIVELCEKKGIYMICDDIYHKLTFDSNTAVPAYHFSKNDVENSHVIVVNGVAKLYGMTGFRIGWVVAPRDLVRVMTNVLAQTTSCVSPVAQAAAEGALNGLQSVVEALRLHIQNNRDVVLRCAVLTESDSQPGRSTHCLTSSSGYPVMCQIPAQKAMVVTVLERTGMEGRSASLVSVDDRRSHRGR